MFGFENTSIRRKLIYIQLATAFLAVIICCGFFLYNDIKVFRESSVKSKASIAEIIGISVTPALEFLDNKAAAQVLDNLKSNPSILNAIIFDKEGKEFARYDKTGEEAFSFSSTGETEMNTHLGSAQKFTVSYKIESDEFLGTVLLRSEISGFRDIIFSYVKIALLILVFSLLIALVISTVLQRSISDRLLSLVSKTKEVADTNNYSIRVSSIGKDEVATLSTSFNNMLVEIEKMQGVLKDTNVELEKRVKVRTRELETINKELKDSEDRFKGFLESAPDAVVIVGEDGVIRIVNAQTEKLFGYSKDELVGQRVEILIPQRFTERHPHHRESFFANPRAREMGLGLELFGKKKTGEEFSVEISLSPLQTKEGLFVSAAIRDITVRKNAEKEIEKLNKELQKNLSELETFNQDLQTKSEELARSNEQLETANSELERFVYVASHDLQEPLRTITNYTGLLQDRYSEKFDETANKYLASTIRAASRMRTLIKDLLELSRIGKEKKITSVNTNEILKEVMAQLDAAISESKAVITASQLPVIRGNEVELKQLFQNLISNSLKFKRENTVPQINITAEERPNEYLFVFKDNGIGIEEEYKDRIFIVFQRLHGKYEYPGTGIGLATCKKIVSLHNGKIWVESRFGEGSSFYFTISKKL